jgi:hypothetical protein
MKTTIILSLLLGSTSVAIGQLYTGTDDYWGGTPTNGNDKYEADVIGDNDVFNLTNWSAEYDIFTNTMTVKISGNYFDDILADSNDLFETSLGDLFISTSGLTWTDGGAATLSDQYGSGTVWDYAVQLGVYDNKQGDLDQFLNTSGSTLSAKVRDLTDPDNQIELSQDLTDGNRYIFRENQEVRVTDDAPQVAGSSANWFIDAQENLIGFNISNFAQLVGPTTNELGFHWTMTCGNDVIEFGFVTGEITPVPEPSLIGALAVGGLGGVLFVRRRIQQKRKAAAS